MRINSDLVVLLIYDLFVYCLSIRHHMHESQTKTFIHSLIE